MFKSVDHAVSWAFNISGTPIVKGSSIYSLSIKGCKQEMSPQDRHAQAALILSMVDRVTDLPGKAFIAAQYGHVLSSGDYGGVAGLSEPAMQSLSVEDILVKAVASTLLTGIHSRRGYSKLIRNYFGGKIGVHAIRTDLKCAMSDIPNHKKAVYNAMDAIWVRAESALDIEMRGHGLIVEL